ncbi:Ribonuclease VapC46 [Mycobacterium simulans]|uniref:Ribonuclease VapC n=1 Tax=Mycobacterium simulans TaxID=627089 RepID=A0A7Z7N8H6_9MYCO|nr:type II toxin-antitoxin system VapC family toxin [Mycobacterium simulans]SOJ53624.1 Ribonuclease VapC46 [Mycobacterium simulans]SON58682.1 Ribonuclease VapC46 [Mycobacterium simulans]
MAAIYLDSSAIVKLAVREPESDALRRYLHARRPRVSSALARTEVMRALLHKGESARTAGRRALASLDLLRIDNRLLNLAGGLAPIGLRTLDAIHLATAQRLGANLGRLCTYDDRIRDAAQALGMAVIAPS